MSRRNYIKKGTRQKWSDESMRAALEAVIKKGSGINKACTLYKVPHTTLCRKVSQCRRNPETQNALLENPKVCLQTVLSKVQENTLCDYISELESAMVGLVCADIRRLAFQLAEKFNVSHRFKKDDGLAGRDWYLGFLRRNPRVKLRKGETPYEKSKVFSKEKVYKFFDSLESLIDKYDLKPSDIYNLDETVITCCSKFMQEVEKSVKFKDYKQNKLVTAVICVSAIGVYTPLLMIFPDEVKTNPLLDGAPPRAWALANSSGQMQLDIFIRWLRKFIDFKKPTKFKPVLILIDGYQSYLKDLNVLELMTENGIHMLCLPPNCTGKLQPLKYSFMDTLSTAYKDEVTKWTISSPGQPVSVDQVFKLFGDAFTKVSTISEAESSFQSTGVWPCNRDLFQHEFVSVTLNASSVKNDSHSMSESSVSVDDCQQIESDVTIPNLDTALHEPMTVLSSVSSQNDNQLYGVEETNQMDQSYEHSVQQGHFIQIGSDPMENLMLQNDNQPSECSIVIPPEAQLTEVQLQDIEFLAQTQRKLYFYASPYKLKL